jgi:hypothetical protein
LECKNLLRKKQEKKKKKERKVQSPCFVGVNGAEGIVLSRHGQLGEQIEERGFADIGHANDSHSEVRACSSQQHFLGFFFFLFAGHSSRDVHEGSSDCGGGVGSV